MYGTFEDIEIYRQKEDIIEKSGIGTWKWYPQKEIVEFSSGYKNMKGYDINEIENSFDSWAKIVHPEDMDYIMGIFNSMLEGKIEIAKTEYRIKHKNGHWIWILDQSKVVEKDEEGKPILVMGTHLDITKRVADHAKLEKFFKLSLDFMCIANTDGYFEKVNQTFISKLGYTEEELLSRPLFEFIHPDDIEATADEIKKLENINYSTVNFINRYKKNDGSYIWFNWVCQPDESGLLYAAARDISNEIKLRAIEKETIELRHQKMVIEKVASNKQQFLANMSHEIRTSMNGVIGMIDVLDNQEGLTPKHKEYIDIIRTSSLSLLNIINDILDLSKLEEGKMKFLNSNFSISKCCDNLKNLYKAIAEKKNLDIYFNIDNNIPDQLCADEHRLKQVLSNLISNALKFTEEGHVNINAHVIEELPNDKVNIQFEVQDTGIGISEQDSNQVFETYEQLNSSIDKQHSGTGLGLGIAKKIVELFNGSIQVESELGKGSKFSFNIIIDKGSELINENTPNSTPDKNIEHKKVLVVDDKDVNITVAKLLLNQLNCSVTCCQNGQEAIDVLKENDFDIIFMDVQMPVMNGINATKIIKDQKLSNSPILALTANAMEGDEEKYLSSGFDGYIPKPIQLKTLKDSIMSIV